MKISYFNILFVLISYLFSLIVEKILYICRMKRCFKIGTCLFLLVSVLFTCVSCGFFSAREAVAVEGIIPVYLKQVVFGDSIIATPHSYDLYSEIEQSPIESLSFLPYTVLDDYWKKGHTWLFKDRGNQLVFDEYNVDKNVHSYQLIYASITDSRIRLDKNIHVGLKREDVLQRLKLKKITDNIQTVCLTNDYNSSTTFYFGNGLLTKIVIRTSGDLLHNPDPIFEHRHAGQVRGYTGKRLYAVCKDENYLASPVCYVNEKGDTIIPFGRFYYCVSDSLAPVGFVLERGVKGIPCINIEGQVTCHALVVDNLTPDYLHEGYFRIVNDDGLMGFADSLGHVTVKPQFKCAFPFEGGKARVTYTGHKSDPDDEHWEWVSDDWFYIDYQGKRQ